MDAGTTWLVDAYGCGPERLRSQETLGRVFDVLVAELDLHPLAPARWHSFPSPGGVTGFLLLTESHLAVHTFPETGLCTLDVHCCRQRPRWPFEERLRELLGAERVVLRTLQRGESAETDPS